MDIQHFQKQAIKPVKVQPKLQVNQPGDRFEQEADAMADKVMRMTDGNQSSFSSSAVTGIIGRSVQRKCAKCEEEEKKKKIMRKEANGASGTTVSSSFSASLLASKTGGHALPVTTRNFMGNAFDTDFSAVRIHTGRKASELNNTIQARAFTHGNDIYFNDRKPAFDTFEGRKLLAHELTHVVQQNNLYNSVQRDSDSELKDPWEIIQGNTSKSVSLIILDVGSRRTRFYTLGNTYMDGIITQLTSSFEMGEYLLERSYSGDADRTWNIFFPDHKKYFGGLQFTVLMDQGIDFDAISYTKPVRLSVVSGVLPKKIDLEKRIKDIVSIAEKIRVNTAAELKIISLLSDIPPEQSEDFVKLLRETKIGDEILIDRLDSVVDLDENNTLHEALSLLKLRARAKGKTTDLSKAPMLAWHDVMGFFEQISVFAIKRTSNGKISIRYLGAISSGLFSTPEYDEIKDMNIKDRVNWMTGGGVELDPDEPVIVHDYDADKFVVLTAEDLITYQHSGKRKFLADTLTIASLATPVGAETALGRAAVITFEKALPALVMLVEENKLNIKKWFPNWGPAILKATEMVKIAIAVYGAAQLVRGSYQLVVNLKRIRNARGAMDAKVIADDANEVSKAESVATQLEKKADDLIDTAEQARKEIGLTLAEATPAEAGLAGAKTVSELESTTVKSKLIEDAISTNKFNEGEFTRLVNKELSNPRVQVSARPGYNIEVPIDGTEHVLARKPNGTWCLFSGIPKGCGDIPVAEDVDQLFAQISAEMKLEPAKIGRKGKVDIAKAIKDAKDAGWVGANGEPIGVDLVVQPHSAASDYRAALGVSGKDFQSAHVGPTAALKKVPGYSREGALTVLMPKATHKKFDDSWKAYSLAQRQENITEVTVDEFLGVMNKAIEQTPDISQGSKNAMAGLLFDEFMKLGLKPNDKIRLPYAPQ